MSRSVSKPKFVARYGLKGRVDKFRSNWPIQNPRRPAPAYKYLQCFAVPCLEQELSVYLRVLPFPKRDRCRIRRLSRSRAWCRQACPGNTSSLGRRRHTKPFRRLDGKTCLLYTSDAADERSSVDL